jgi:hypothetical protein
VSFLDDYQPVEDRLREFWEKNSEGRVTTELVTPNAAQPGDVIIFRCEVYRLPPVQTITVQGETAFPDATGYAHQRILESPPAKRNGDPNYDAPEWSSPWEVAETSAIGRALANLGYAAKGKRPSREEMSKTSPAAPSRSERQAGSHAPVAAGDTPSEGAEPVETIADGEDVIGSKAPALSESSGEVGSGVGSGGATSGSASSVDHSEDHTHLWVDSPKLSKWQVCSVENCMATQRKAAA